MIVRKLLDDSYVRQGLRSTDISNHPISQKRKNESKDDHMVCSGCCGGRPGARAWGSDLRPPAGLAAANTASLYID